jgi:peptidyl-prolyl cis-trans isomerase B (cyclophilin B)
MANGKKVSEIRTKVKELWPTIVFEEAGRPVVYKAKLETEEGDIEIEFYPKVAPNHARSFICLCKAGYYDGLNFHRCIDGFMIQGGCAYGNGQGGPGYRLIREANDTPHDVGILSAARTRAPDTAGAQFFLCLSREGTQSLDKQYTVFGKVTTGMEVVKKIVARPKGGPEGSTPDNPCKIIKATVKATMN